MVHGREVILPLVCVDLGEAVVDFRRSGVVAECSFVRGDSAGEIARGFALFRDGELMVRVAEAGEPGAGG